MKDEYQRLEASLQDLYENVSEMVSIVKGPTLSKLGNKISRQFVTVNHHLKKVEDFIPIVDPITLKNQWGGDDFETVWKFYKDYLKEQHGFVMHSRMELMRLSLIRKIAKDNVSDAVLLLEYIMAQGSKTIYEVDDVRLKEQKTGTHESTKQDETIVKLPFAIPKNR